MDKLLSSTENRIVAVCGIVFIVAAIIGGNVAIGGLNIRDVLSVILVSALALYIIVPYWLKKKRLH